MTGALINDELYHFVAKKFDRFITENRYDVFRNVKETRVAKEQRTT